MVDIPEVASKPPERKGWIRMPELTTPEWITAWASLVSALVAIASVAVAYATYRVASDSGDMKKAVENISELATQTKHQVDEVRREADAAARLADLTSISTSLSVANQLPFMGFRGASQYVMVGPNQSDYVRRPFPAESIFSLGLQNIGGGNAEVERVSYDWRVSKEPPSTPVYSRELPLENTERLTPGGFIAPGIRDTIHVSDSDRAAIDQETKSLWLWGRVTFRDQLGGENEYGFLLRWYPAQPPAPDVTTIAARMVGWVTDTNHAQYSFRRRNPPLPVR